MDEGNAVSPVLIFIVVVGVVTVAGSIIGAVLNSKRQGGLRTATTAREWSYSPQRDRTVSRHFRFLNEISEGRNRYATDVIRGRWNRWPIIAFSHHHEDWNSRSSHNQGGSTTDHTWTSVVALQLPTATSPELTITPKGLFGGLGKLFSDNDVELPHAPQLLQAYRVRASYAPFAEQVCHPAMVAYLLANPGTSLEIERDWLATFERGRLHERDLDRRLATLGDLVALLPANVREPR